MRGGDADEQSGPGARRHGQFQKPTTSTAEPPQDPSGLVIPMYDTQALDGREDKNAIEVTRESMRERPPPKSRPSDTLQPTAGPHYPVPDVPVHVFGYDYPRPSVVKNYTVNLNNPLTSQSLEVVNAIYQDFLLPSVAEQKFSSLRSREAIYQVVRNLVLAGSDGQEIHLASQRYHSLMTQLKLLEAAANPLRPTTDDPYRSNPFDAIVAKCGYPIRYQNTGQVSLARENISMNIRLYRLDNAEYRFSTLSFFSELEMNPWRELLWYQMIRQKVLQPKQSPHFPFLYGYFLCKSTIRFDTFNDARQQSGRLSAYKQHKLRKYAIKLADNERSLGAQTSATVVVEETTPDGQPNIALSGAGVVLVDAYQPPGGAAVVHRVLFSRIPSDRETQFKVSAGPLERIANHPLTVRDAARDLKKMVAEAACKSFNYNVLITPNMLDEATKFYVDMDGGYKFKMYFVKCASFPLNKPDLLATEFDDLNPTSSMFDGRTQKIIAEAKNQIVAGLQSFDYIFPQNIIPPMYARIERVPLRENWALFHTTTSQNGTLVRPGNAGGNPRTGWRWSPMSAEGLATPSGVSLGLLTESPTHNLLQWCSKNYTSSRNVIRKMTRLGIYQDHVWKNIIFQILQGAATMVANGFAIRNMTIENSIYIKDLQSLSNQYWIYKVGGVQYYLPHVGYLVVYDIGGTEADDFESKIISTSWGADGNAAPTTETVVDTVHTGLRNILNHANFSPPNLKANCNPPSQNIMQLLTSIHNDLDGHLQARNSQANVTPSDPSIIPTIMQKYFTEFFHPRIGTFVTEPEMKQMDDNPPRERDLVPGEIVADTHYSLRQWKWAYYGGLRETVTNGQVRRVHQLICAKRGEDQRNGANLEVTENVGIGRIRRYLGTRPIDMQQTQRCTSLTAFTYESCIEQYSIDDRNLRPAQ